jgi:hypothetical protein
MGNGARISALTKWDGVERGYQHSLCEYMGAGDISTHNVGTLSLGDINTHYVGDRSRGYQHHVEECKRHILALTMWKDVKRRYQNSPCNGMGKGDISTHLAGGWM